MKKYKSKQVQISHNIQMILSRMLSDTAEGLFLRRLIFNKDTMLPDNAILTDLILEYFPEKSKEIFFNCKFIRKEHLK